MGQIIQKFPRRNPRGLIKQYYVDFEVNKQESFNSIKIAEEFIAEMNNLIATLNEEKVKDYHEKALVLFTEEDKKKI